MRQDSKIYVAGHAGLVGSALLRRLQKDGYSNLITRSHAELDLTDSASADAFFFRERPEYVLLAAAKVGGILANATAPGEFLRANLLIQTHVIEAARKAGVEKLLFLGSSCIYPRNAPQPMKEERLLSGPLEPTNEAYAIAKLAGIKMCQAYRRQYKLKSICLMPANLYGPGDNFDLETAHVLPALLRKFHEAKVNGAPQAVVWGSGTPRREFLHVDDLAEAALFLMLNYDSGEIINVGTGEDISIRELAELASGIVGFQGEIVFDPTKPDGVPRKLLDVTHLRTLGWKPKVALREGIAQTYEWYKENAAVAVRS